MLPSLSVALLAFLFASSTNAITFLLDSTQYPDIADAHCLSAFCAGLGFNTRNYGFHRSTSTQYMSERRKAMGCDSSICDSGETCSPIPYVSTFDAGLGCYADEWAESGRTMSWLYSVATRRCVPSDQISAHEDALQQFYDDNNIKNFQLYSVDVATVLDTGYADPRSTLCNKFIQAALTGKSFNSICAAANADGSQFKKINSPSQYNKGSCPTRSEFQYKSRRADKHRRAKSKAKTTDSKIPVTFSLLENGVRTLNLFGPHDVGNDVWAHGKLAKLFSGPGSKSKIKKVGSTAGVPQAIITSVSGLLKSILGLH